MLLHLIGLGVNNNKFGTSLCGHPICIALRETYKQVCIAHNHGGRCNVQSFLCIAVKVYFLNLLHRRRVEHHNLSRALTANVCLIGVRFYHIASLCSGRDLQLSFLHQLAFGIGHIAHDSSSTIPHVIG